jgi:quercetin dioxygenase-like cupin family protein
MLEFRAMRSRVFLALSALFFALTVLAQSANEVEIAAEPHHHLALENAYVRVFQVEAPAGGATLLHRHRHDYVHVMLGGCEISNEVEGKLPMRIKLQNGETSFAAGNFAHMVRDIGPTPFRNVTIELLQDEKARKSPPLPWDEERGLQVLEGGTKDILFVKDGVRVSEVDLRPGGMIPKHHHSGPHLAVAITDMNLGSEVAGKGSSNIELKAGEIKWVPGGFTHMVMNQGKHEAKFITLEFK